MDGSSGIFQQSGTGVCGEFGWPLTENAWLGCLPSKYSIRFVNDADLKGLVDRKAVQVVTTKWAELKPSLPCYAFVTFRRFTRSLSRFCNRRTNPTKTDHLKNCHGQAPSFLT